MERKIYWGIGIVSILLLAVSFFMPGKPASKDDLPWHIEHPTPDTIRVFGLTLGLSTTNDAERHFREEAKSSLFRSPEGKLVAEMFFEQVVLAGLKSRIVLTVAVPETELQGMYERGLRVSGASTGKKITLAPDDVARVRALPISSLTYLPTVRIDEETFSKRFGQPAQRIREKDSGAIHWLYPQYGLDITFGNEGKPLLQYVLPGDFDKLTRPLLMAEEPPP